MEFFGNIIKGIMIGIANIIPGVSGGTMAVSLGNFIRAVATFHGCSLGNYAGICAETECAALVNVFALTGHEVNNLIFAYFIKFARMCV